MMFPFRSLAMTPLGRVWPAALEGEVPRLKRWGKEQQGRRRTLRQLECLTATQPGRGFVFDADVGR
jgi:hypothetical protein